jgi:O-acetylserine/cysteine efflux transporter
MNPRDIALAAIVAILWGLNFIAAKLSVAEIPPMTAMILRFVIVGGLLVPFVPIPWGRLRQIAVLSFILGTVHFSLIFYGIRGTDAATASIIAQLQVPFSSLLAALFFKDKLGWRRASGMVVAFIGVFVVVGEPRFQGAYSAFVFLVGASLAFALANIQIKRIGAIDGFVLNGWMALLAIPQLMIVSAIFEHDQIQAVLNA